MEFYFNELSLQDKGLLTYEDVSNLIQLYTKAMQAGIRKCRISHEASEAFKKLYFDIDDVNQNRNRRAFYYSFFTAPYENKAVEDIQDQYLSHRWKYKDSDCYGLALSHLCHSISLSINGEEWNRPFLEIKCDEHTYDVRNTATADHIAIHQEWLDQQKDVVLLKTDLMPAEKKIHFRKDHGIDELQKHANRIVNCEYVEEVINSIDFSPHQKEYIKAIHDDGLIEIVLTWTDPGYGMVIATTGRSRRETEKIAEILKEKYGTC